MAYPPSAIAADKTDNTATNDDHAPHHNELANAVNDIVTELGADPSGGAASVTVRLSALDSTVAAEAALARNADNLTSGTVADARIPSTIARDAEVSSAIAAEAALARDADNLTSGTVADARIPSTIARDTEVASAVAAEAALARNADNLTSGTVADARIAASIARDSEVTAAVAAEATARDAAIGTAVAAEATLARNADNLTSGTVADARIAATIARDAEVAAAVAAEATARDTAIATAIANLVASAPGVLDTLDEIAAALGDDPNFAATITTALAGKQPLDADLTAIAALASAANKLAYATGSGAWSLTDFTAFARTLLDDADAATALETLGLGGVTTDENGWLHAPVFIAETGFGVGADLLLAMYLHPTFGPLMNFDDGDFIAYDRATNTFSFAVAGVTVAAISVGSTLALLSSAATTAFGRALLNVADAAALRTAAGLGTAATANTGDFQPVDSDLTAIAALSTTSYGRAFLALADAAAGRTALGLGTAATTAATDYQPVDSDLTAIAALTTTAFGRGFLDLADAAAARTKLALGTAATQNTGAFDAAGAAAAAQAASQPLDADLTAIAALTTTSFGRSLLEAADAAALRGLSLAAPATPTVGTSLGTTGTVNLDLAALNGTFQTIALTGNITFTTSNLAAGRTVSLFISAAALRTFTFPSWIFVGAAAPASIAAGKAGVLTLTSTGTTDAAVYAAWAAQP